MNLNVSLYIPVYNGESTIEKVIKSVLKLSYSPNEIIIINDGSTDNTKNIINKYKGKIKIIDNKINKGLGYCRNLGIKQSLNENVASIDADVEVHNNWLKDLVELKEKYQSSICGGELIEKYIDNNMCNYWRHIHARQNPFGIRDIENLNQALAGSNILLNKNAWESAGGYEEKFKTHGEDFTFCNKLRSLNFKISYSSKAKCYHLRNDTLMSLANASRRAYIYGAGLKKPTFMKFVQRSIRHLKGFVVNSISDFLNLRFKLIYVSFVILINHIIKEFISFIKKKPDYV